jgi:hypothetical protein
VTLSIEFFIWQIDPFISKFSLWDFVQNLYVFAEFLVQVVEFLIQVLNQLFFLLHSYVHLSPLRDHLSLKKKTFECFVWHFNHFIIFTFSYWRVVIFRGVLCLAFSFFLFLKCDLHICWGASSSVLFGDLSEQPSIESSIPITTHRQENKLPYQQPHQNTPNTEIQLK